jgi:hypothetical protein
MCVEQKLGLYEHLDFLTVAMISILGFEPVNEGEYIDFINLCQLCVNTVVVVY